MPQQTDRAYLRCPHCGGGIALVPEIPRKKKPHRDWAAIDWSRPTEELVRELGSSRSTLAIYRRKYAPDTMGRHASAHSWERIDWSRKNRDIAIELGVAPQTVSAKRTQHAPHTVIARRRA